jgi:hypothetical protein
MIFRHYRELATPEQARSWFSITPEIAENVVPRCYPRGHRYVRTVDRTSEEAALALRKARYLDTRTSVK